jgi:pimeloyl-ACP methyl ester carboxylesterase
VKLAWRVQLPSGDAAGKDRHDVVLLHGTGSNSQMWEKHARFLASKGHRSFLIDLRGHGQSLNLPESCGLLQHEEDILETMKDAGVEFPAYFVGHSLGAIIAVSLASKRPELVKGIFAASLPGKVLPPLPLALKGFVRGPLQTVRSIGLHNILAWREKTLLEMKPAVLNDIAHQFAGVNLVEKPLPVKCPVHFASGVFDPVAPYWHVLTMHRLLPGSTLKTFKLGGHNFMDAEENSVNSWLEQHLDSTKKDVAPHHQ